MPIYLRGSGEIRPELPLVYYPIGNYMYVCSDGKHKEIVFAEKREETNDKGKVTKKWFELEFNGETYLFKDQPIGNLNSMPYTNYITEEIAKEWIEEKYTIPFNELWKKINNAIAECYEFNNEKDLNLTTLFILQSWFVDVLNAVFYLDIRSSMGGGKTTLIEIIKILSRYGILANDVSMAVIPRLLDKYKCTLVIDEIDQINIKSKEDVYKILRTGYRKGQKYIRAKPRTFEPETFDCYGAKAFNYRSDIVDDLKSRSIPIDTSISKDKTKPVLNLHKETFLKEVFPYIWGYYMNSIDRIHKISKLYEKIVVGKNNVDIGFLEGYEDLLVEEQVNKLTRLTGLKVNDNTTICSRGYSRFMCITYFLLTALTLLTPIGNEGKIIGIPNSFNSDLESFIKRISGLVSGLNGRNIELFYIILELCAYLGTDIFDWFSEPLSEKQEFEGLDETDYKSTLKEILIKMYYGQLGADPYYHSSGEFKFFFYRDVQNKFNDEIRRLYGVKPSSNELKKQLREIGFVDKIDKKVIKFEGKAVLAIIFTEKILKKLGLEVIEEKIEKSKEVEDG
jgi:hypothetical protein